MVQTAESVVEEGIAVFVVCDATESRTLDGDCARLVRLNVSGVGIVTTGKVVFEWPGQAETSASEELLPLIK